MSPELRLGSTGIASRAKNGNIKNFSQIPLGSPMMAYHYKENSERLNPSCSSRALSLVNLHDYRLDHGVDGSTIQGNKSVSNIRQSKQASVCDGEGNKLAAGNRLRAFITDNNYKNDESSKQPGSPKSSVPSVLPCDKIKREVLIDLSNLNLNVQMSRSFVQGASKTQDFHNNYESNISDIIKLNIEDRELNKMYLQYRDFDNKVHFLDNFSGDPFKIVHN